MLDIPSLGPKTISLFWKEKGITSLDELKKAIEDKTLEGIKGVGAKKLDSIKQGIELLARSAGRLGIFIALPVAQSLVAQLREIKGVKAAEYAGSLRRRKETIGDLDLICTLETQAKGDDISAAFTKLPEVERILVQGPPRPASSPPPVCRSTCA